jgi:hypothetical protein
MRILIIISLIAISLFGCEESAGSTKARVDSTVTKLDSAFEKIEGRADAAWDSTKAKAKEFKKDLDSTFDRKRDSSKRN